MAGLKGLFLSILDAGACLKSHSGASLSQKRWMCRCNSWYLLGWGSICCLRRDGGEGRNMIPPEVSHLGAKSLPGSVSWLQMPPHPDETLQWLQEWSSLSFHSSGQARFTVHMAETGVALQYVGLWAGTVMDDSERLSLYFCSVHSVLLSS